MLYELPEKVLGQTHIRFNDIEHRVGSSVTLSGRYGTLDGDGNFITEEKMVQASRTISGAEYAAMFDASKLEDHEKSDVRAEVVLPWLDDNGVTESKFVVKAAIAEAAEAEVAQPGA